MTDLSSVHLRPRDAVLLRGLFESRVMTTGHAAMLYFDGKGEAAKKRLQKLKSAGLITDRPRRAFEPSVLLLTLKGLEILQEHGVLAGYPPFDLPALDRRARVSDLTIRHELEVMDVKTGFHSAVGKLPSFSIAEFSTWPMLHEFRAYGPGSTGSEVLVKPDGFIRIHETEGADKFEHAFFLELDRSSENQEKLLNKAACYREFYATGGFALRNGAIRDDYGRFPFRVLMVFKTAERRNNTAERLLQINPPILTMAWLATFAEVTANPFGPVWIRPSEYRDVTKSTPFDAGRSNQTFAYRRNGEREAFIESNIRKRRLLGT